MSASNQIKQDWARAIAAATKPVGIIDRSEQIQIAVGSDGAEYYIESYPEAGDVFKITHPNGIRCNVWKKNFRLRWVSSDHKLHPHKLDRN